MFVFRPQLLKLDATGATADAGSIAAAFLLALLGVAPLAAAVAGHLVRPTSAIERGLLFVSAALALFPGQATLLGISPLSLWNLGGIGLFGAVAALQLRSRPSPRG